MSIRIANKNNRAIRIENIPRHSQQPVDPLTFFKPEDRDKLVVKSIAPAVHIEDGDEVEYVATLACRSSDVDLESLSLDSDEVTLDYDFHGFTPLNAPSEPVADVIAVSGVGQHPFDIFAHSAGQLWLRDRLGSGVSNARFLLYGPSHELNLTSGIIRTHAMTLLSRLSELPRPCNHKTVFIGHGTGCLIIQQVITMLAGSQTQNPSEDISGIIFFEVPSSGFDDGHLQRMTYLYPEAALSGLKVGSPLVSSLHAEFGRVVGSIPVITCISSSGITDRAQLGWVATRSYPCTGDYFTAAKLRPGAQSGAYHAVMRELAEMLANSPVSSIKGSIGAQSSPSAVWIADNGTLSGLRSGNMANTSSQQSYAIPKREKTTNSTSSPAPARPASLSAYFDTQESGYSSIQQSPVTSPLSRGDLSRIPSNRLPPPAIMPAEPPPPGIFELSAEPVMFRSPDIQPQPPSPIIHKFLARTVSTNEKILVESSISTIEEKIPVVSPDPRPSEPRRSSSIASSTSNPPPRSPRIRRESTLNKLTNILSRSKPNDAGPMVTGLFFDCVKRDDVQEVEAMLKQNMSVHAKAEEDDHNTALHYAARYGHRRMCRFLLNQGAEINKKTTDRRMTPLHEAASNGHESVVMFLVDKQANPNAQSDEGNTPLHVAAAEGHINVVKALVSKDADVMVVNRDGRTALAVATKAKQSEVAQYLERKSERKETVLWPGLA